VRQRRVVGSATVCLLALHPSKPELLAASVGDSGFLVLRARQSEAARMGTLGRRGPARDTSAARGYQVAFRSPQQLRSFNAPFQLGLADEASDDGPPDSRFETPQDAALMRVPVLAGDVVVIATDGLFDNMEEEAIVELVDESEGEGTAALAERLARRAQELSLDRNVDSPFALLAKENDILWGGGRPDDITVVVCSVTDRSERSAAASSNDPRGSRKSHTPPLTCGPGPPPV